MPAGGWQSTWRYRTCGPALQPMHVPEWSLDVRVHVMMTTCVPHLLGLILLRIGITRSASYNRYTAYSTKAEGSLLC